MDTMRMREQYTIHNHLREKERRRSLTGRLAHANNRNMLSRLRE
jgi:hypothetical protein